MYEIEFEVASEDWPRLEQLLEDLGALAVTQAGGNTAIFAEPGVANLDQWTRFLVVALFDDEVDQQSVRDALRTTLTGVAIETRAIEDQAWAETWKLAWQPQMYDGGLCVCPSWCEAPASARHVIHLDPGQAFGTGTHPTTTLCINWLASLAPLDRDHVIDYGCGSGILALAATRFAAQTIEAVDIDPDALTVARENAVRNAAAVTVAEPTTLSAGRATVLVANILLAPLLSLEPEFARLLAPRGRIALAGLLTTQVAEVERTYAANFALDPATAIDGWALLTGTLRQ